MDSDLIMMILSVADVHDDTEQSGMVFMPSEEEWGLIVGLARKKASEDVVEEKQNV